MLNATSYEVMNTDSIVVIAEALRIHDLGVG